MPGKRRIRYEMSCPNCHYHYYMELFEKFESERCPCCGHSQKFEGFGANICNTQPDWDLESTFEKAKEAIAV
jgi:hypothetical protein